MPNQQVGRAQGVAHMCRCRQQIGHVRAEIGVGKLALAGADAGEIETQHRDAMPVKSVCNTPRGENVLTTGETVGKQGPAPRLTIWQFQQG